MERLRARMKKWLTPSQRRQLKRLVKCFFTRDLCALATLEGSDKWGRHWYARHYQRHFSPLRKRRLKVLEIGVGGYENPTDGGASLRMWKAFFPNSQIYAVDIYDKSPLQEARITIIRGS